MQATTGSSSYPSHFRIPGAGNWQEVNTKAQREFLCVFVSLCLTPPESGGGGLSLSEVLEIRWHGRGGQGAKTAALMFGEAALETGKYIQAFPEYGPERMGAPVAAYNRLSDEPIQVHSGIKNPRIVLVLDPSLIKAARVLNGLQKDGILLINTQDNPKAVKQELGLQGTKIRVWTVDANQIATDCFGKAIPNTPMLGALVRISGVLDFDAVMTSIKDKLNKKFRGKDKLVTQNLEAVKRAYDEVRSSEDPGVPECVPKAYCPQNPDECSDATVEVLPKTWKDLPCGPHLRDLKKVRENRTGAWRSRRPHWSNEKCIQCLICWIYCPDAAIKLENGKIAGFDYDYCKGCGICADICPKKANAITMGKEEK
jgi:pyruvate ferredoxin oxidoreductase gamma subunit